MENTDEIYEQASKTMLDAGIDPQKIFMSFCYADILMVAADDAGLTEEEITALAKDEAALKQIADSFTEGLMFNWDSVMSTAINERE